MKQREEKDTANIVVSSRRKSRTKIKGFQYLQLIVGTDQNTDYIDRLSYDGELFDILKLLKEQFWLLPESIQ